MADLAAQREARRRKITQNAEARMNRVMGLTSEKSVHKNESPSQNLVTHNSEEPPYTTRLHSHSSLVSTSPTSRHNPAAVATSTAAADKSSNKTSDDNTHVRTQTAETKVIAQDAVLQPPKERLELTSRTNNSLGVFSGLNAQMVDTMRVVILVITTLLTRLVLKFDVDLYLVQSIFVPFVVLEITFKFVINTYLQHVPLFTANGNLMSAALMLCGMRQDILDTYNNIMAHITLWVNDFCVYFFSFIVWNSLFA